MTKILYNNCYGGFGLSKEALAMYKQKAGIDPDTRVYHWDIDRADPILIEAVETLGLELSGDRCSRLAIREVPSGVKYRIDEYDGNEAVMTIDEYDWKVA
jgi:hypothetical protein